MAPLLCLGQKLTIHVIKSQIHLVRQSLIAVVWLRMGPQYRTPPPRSVLLSAYLLGYTRLSLEA
jgi:hypothetical protein